MKSRNFKLSLGKLHSHKNFLLQNVSVCGVLHILSSGKIKSLNWQTEIMQELRLMHFMKNHYAFPVCNVKV